MLKKNLVLESKKSKKLQNNQNTEFCKLQYLASVLRYKVEFLLEITHLLKHQICSDILNGCGQACLGMLKVMPDIESALSQK